ncbi:MAG: glutamine--fructose-6-phosphate transaminase (isomerizing) [Clostridia bacterium]|nr:glutamine--fructose-6-phosphate transaminase (isomerizing) [Clostridia bacterium]
MCGIVGYIGTQKAEPILINGLLRLEYRGYDSAGIATIENNGIKNIKNKGRVNDLLSVKGIENLKGTIGIGHTRWATHGKPSSENSHPHLDNSNTFAVVHNGIIENYAELRKDLESKGYHFLSETDTEVIPNLIHYFYNKSNLQGELKFLSAVNETCKMLKGSFALEIISSDYPDSMIVVRKDSPLVIGTSPTEHYISSDIPAILSFTKDFYLLNDLEFAYLSRNSIKFYDSALQEISKTATSIEWSAAAAEKDGFEDFMLKEIYEQPKSIRETIGSHIIKDGKCIIDGLDLSKEYLQTINKIFIVACGTAMHAGLACKTVLEQICEISTEVDIASEFRYRNPLINKNTLCIFISQSGETADTIAALKLAREKGAKTIAISNVIGSSISREADYTIYTHAGPEIAVASTKAYTAQIMLLDILALYLAETLEINLDKVEIIKKELLEIPSKVEECLALAPEVKEFANKVYKEKDIFFLGRGLDYSSSLEASLKLKEISYIHSDAYAAGELKHGPIALIENGITVIGILTVPHLVEKTVSNLQEVITRGAKTLIVTNQDLGDKKFDKVIRIPEASEYVSPILSIIPMQLFAYYISKEKGLDVDKPRNLAKSVTVE